ncbi:hypothetical protein [Paenibacillus sp. GYB003]|uniref:hypothetical protein n=1 Tax=Paenibacillus sp. GYB003 TaxID=2994392 RepID=UPI002F96313C
MNNKMTRFAAKALLCLALAGPAVLPAQIGPTPRAAAEGTGKIAATWMWNTYAIWRDKDGTLDYLAQNGINLVYLQADDDIPPDVYRTFIREAGARGIEVHALAGKPDWVLPGHQGELYDFIYWVKAYNNGSRSSERFGGIHLDVEPYVLPQWQTDRDTLIGYWMDTVSGFAQQVKSDSYLTTGVDIPVWLDGFLVPDGKGGTTTLTDYIIGRFDHITMMAYIDNAEGIVKAVSKELTEAAGKPIVIGVETMNNYEANSSFYAKGRAAMTSELGTVVGALSSHPSYGGYAVHEFDSWMRLKE